MHPASDPLGDEHGGLPYVDEHRTTIAASRDLVWRALRHYVDSSLGVGERHPLARLLGTEPPGGFEVAQEIPGRHLSLAGRHRFSRYRLVFDLADVAGGKTLLSARTYAAFPGLHGRTYRALVIGTRGHVVAVNRMLRTVGRRSLKPTDPFR
jgi:hypothetical protein